MVSSWKLEAVRFKVQWDERCTFVLSRWIFVAESSVHDDEDR